MNMPRHPREHQVVGSEYARVIITTDLEGLKYLAYSSCHSFQVAAADCYRARERLHDSRP